MLTLLTSVAKTVPSNHTIEALTVTVPGSEIPGYSITEEQMEKARRMEDPHYDWSSYQAAIRNSLFDHPALAHREHEEAVTEEWNKVLNSLEPFRRR